VEENSKEMKKENQTIYKKVPTTRKSICSGSMEKEIRKCFI